MLDGDRPHLRAPPQPFAGREYPSVHHEEDRGGERLGEDHAELMLQGDAEDPRGDGGDDEQPREALVGRFDASSPDRAEERGDDADPVLSEDDEKRERGADVQGDDECEEERLGGRLRAREIVPAEEAGEEDGMPETGDGEKLRDALKKAHHDGLEV